MLNVAPRNETTPLAHTHRHTTNTHALTHTLSHTHVPVFLSTSKTQAGAAAAAQLAKRVAGAVGDGVGAAVAPFALFDSGWTTNVLFWVVLSLLLYNLVLLAPRQ